MNKKYNWAWQIMPMIGAAALCIMMGVTIMDIVLRNLFNSPIQGSYEIVQLCLVSAVFACLGEVFRQGIQIAVDLIDNVAPKLTKILFKPLGNILSFGVIAIFLYGAIHKAIEVKGYGDVTIDLQLFVYWYWIPVIFGLSVALIGIVLNIFSHSKVS